MTLKNEKITRRAAISQPGIHFAAAHEAGIFADIAWVSQEPIRDSASASEKETFVAMTTKKISRFLRENKYDVLKAYSLTDPQKIIGYLAYRKNECQWQGEHLFALPNEERCGTRLMLEFLHQAKESGVQKITLQPLQKINKPPFYDSAPFYERFGFRQKRNCRMELCLHESKVSESPRLRACMEMN